MTLAVAIRFPWPSWVDELPKEIRAIDQRYPSLQSEQALIFASDSRWSYDTGRPFDDGAVKVAAIDSHGAAIYAGNVDAGELSLARLNTYFTQARLGQTPGDIRDLVRSVWRQTSSGPKDTFQLCLGFLDGTGHYQLFRFDNWNDFVPKEVVGIECLGWPSAISYFKNHLHQQVEKEMSAQMTQQALDLSADHWATTVQMAIHQTCKNQVHPTVGGPTIGLTVKRGGVQGFSLHSVDFNTNPPSVKSLSLTAQQVNDFYQHPRRASRRNRLPLRRSVARANK